MNLELNENKLRSQLRSADDAARHVLEHIFSAGRPADRALSGWLRENRHCGSRDRHFIGEAVYALLRYWGLLRKFLPSERLAEIESGRIRLGSQELKALFLAAFYLEKRQPAAVELIVRDLMLAGPKNQSRKTAEDSIYARAAELAGFFGLKTLTFAPEDLVPEWVLTHLGEAFPRAAFLADLERRPPMWLRMQCHDPDRLIAELRSNGLDVHRHDRLQSALAVIAPHVNLYTLDSFRSGEFEVQDLASQCIGLTAAPKPGERWLDCCAGAGGKTLQLAELMRRTGKITACDVRSYKLDDLRLRARRAGFPNIDTAAWDGNDFKLKPERRYDGVLVDAPCSCSGVWRRNPDGRWTLKEEEIAEHATLQRQILERGAKAVRPGGVLIYATCSIFPEENGEVVRSFLAANRDFEPEDFPHPLNGNPTGGLLQIYSFEGDCDSMFVARMRRGNDSKSPEGKERHS